jgi:integrase
MPRSQQTITKTLVDREKPEEEDRFIWDDELPGFGLKITPAGRKAYVFQYRMESGRGAPSRRYTIGKHGEPWTPSTARIEAGKLADRVKAGDDPMEQKKIRRQNTVEGLIANFMASRRQRGLKSADQIERILKKHIPASWKRRAATSITPEDVQKLVDAIADQHVTQACRVASYLKTMFRWALTRGVPVSPAEGVQKPGKERSRTRTPTVSELAEIWRGAGTLGYPFGPAIKTLILTGQRRNEVAGMGWSEVERTLQGNLEAAVWTIPAFRAKNGEEHIVHLTPFALDVFTQCPMVQDQDLIFSTTGKTKISGWGKIKKRLDKAVHDARQQAAKAAGQDPDKVQPMPHWVLHDLRRSLATGLSDRGVPPHVADRILNHTSRTKGGVAAVYNKAQYANERREALRLWSDTIEAALE